MVQTIQEFEECEPKNEFHAINTIVFGDLIESNFIDWNSEDWKWDAYNEDQYKRVCKKFEQHYYWREIGVLPLARFRWEVRRTFNENMPKYKPFYQALDDGTSILQTAEDYGKNRNVYSDFPATQLKPKTQDYATNATDNAHDTVSIGDWLDKAQQIKSYNDIDLMLILDCEDLFCSLLTTNINL